MSGGALLRAPGDRGLRMFQLLGEIPLRNRDGWNRHVGALSTGANLQDFVGEWIDGICPAHLHRGIFNVHGNDEACRGEEPGHDVMRYTICDAALDSPPVTPDMSENTFPRNSGPAKPVPEALSVGDFIMQLHPSVDPLWR